MRAVILWVAMALPVGAQEFVHLGQPVDDQDFYRAVACAAPPGRDCEKRFIRWDKDVRSPLSVGFGTLTPALHAYQQRLYDQGLVDAIAQINAIGADIWLELDPESPRIAIHVIDTAPGEVIEGTGNPMLDGNRLPLGMVAVRSDQAGVIQEATIAISAKTRRRAIASVILEELVQSLGLMTDIRSPAPAYRRSVFSEDSNSGTRLRGQDAAAVLLHYPRD